MQISANNKRKLAAAVKQAKLAEKAEELVITCIDAFKEILDYMSSIETEEAQQKKYQDALGDVENLERRLWPSETRDLVIPYTLRDLLQAQEWVFKNLQQPSSRNVINDVLNNHPPDAVFHHLHQ